MFLKPAKFKKALAFLLHCIFPRLPQAWENTWENDNFPTLVIFDELSNYSSVPCSFSFQKNYLTIQSSRETMCSTFILPPRRNNCNKSSSTIAYSKSQHEAPKQLLQLRSEIKPLIPLNQPSNFWESSQDSGVLSSLSSSPQQRSGLRSQKLHLTYIEKNKRVRAMIPQQQHYHAFDRPTHYNSRKTSGPPPLMRTPSSGFSSASSSENMFSGLTLSDNENKIHEIMDPSVDVDLDMFLLPDCRYKQPVQPSTSTSRNNVSQISGSSRLNGSTRHVAPIVPKVAMPSELSYANVKRSSGYVDYMPTTYNSNVTSNSSAASVPMSPGTWVRCHYCWESYVKLCQRVANLEPLISCDGPWNWHTLYDMQGRVTCPRLWFAQLDRAGSEMVEQMGHARNVPV